MERDSNYSSAGAPRDSGNLVQEQVKQGTQQAVQQTQQVVGQVTDTARQQATSMASNQKDKAAESLTGVAGAFRQAGRELEQNDQAASFAGPVNMLADRVERFGSYLREREVSELVGDVEYYARRSPAIFVSGGVLLGLLAARFLKSSSPSRGFMNQQGEGRLRGGSRYSDTGSGNYYGRSSQRGQYGPSDVQHRVEDVGGMPEIGRRYSPGMMGDTADSGTESTYASGQYSRDVSGSTGNAADVTTDLDRNDAVTGRGTGYGTARE